MAFYGKAKTIVKDYQNFAAALNAAAAVECYRRNPSWNNKYHTDALGDSVEWDELVNSDLEIDDWELMDEVEYNATVLANTCTRFDELFNPGDKVLVILYTDPEQATVE